MENYSATIQSNLLPVAAPDVLGAAQKVSFSSEADPKRKVYLTFAVSHCSHMNFNYLNKDQKSLKW